MQTIVGYYLRRPKPLRPTKVHKVPLPDGDVLALCENRPMRKSSLQPAIVFMHGLGGCASSPYMIRMSKLFQDRGWCAFRMNHRGCGEGSRWARQIYHSGRSEDVSAALSYVAELYSDRPLIAVGFSLSGNALLKLLGEGKYAIPDSLAGAIAVTPPIELSRCATELARTQKRIYDLRFIRLLKENLRQRRDLFSDFPALELPRYLTIRDFDQICTAPLNGFESAEDYYTKCSAKQFIEAIVKPTVVVASSDDPFIPTCTFDGFPSNPKVELLMTQGGGHMGYVAYDRTSLGTRHWLDYAVLTLAESFLKQIRRAICRAVTEDP